MHTFNKFLLFLTGLLLGIILSAGTIWYIYGGAGKNIFVVHPSRNKAVEKNNSEEKNNSNFSLKPSRKDLKREKSEILDSVTLVNEVIAGITKQDSLPVDTFLTIATTVTTEPEEIIIKKDELLFSRLFTVVDLSPKGDADQKKDSLLQAASGINNPPSVSYSVEFWKSPINYKGYKAGKNKIVLFGILTQENISFYKLDDKLYLKNNDRIFRIERRQEFSPYEPVNDPEILSQLK